LKDAGDIAPAAAMPVLIVLATLGIRLLCGIATRGFRRRSQAWMGS